MLNIEKIKIVSKLLQELLEPILTSQCQVANYKNGCLTLQTKNAAVATRLRYQIPEILEKLRQPDYLPGLASIKCIVRPHDESVMNNQEASPAFLELKDSVVDAAKSADPRAGLQEALLRLSKTLKKAK